MSIKSWSLNERPRERLLQKGADSLSDAELLAIFLRSGVKGKSAVDLARELLSHFGSLKSLFNASADDFKKTCGIGTAKYTQLKAILEMSRRYLFESLNDKPLLTNAKETKEFLLAQMGHLDHEIFASLFLNAQNQLIDFTTLFTGSINQAPVYPREIIKTALHKKAVNIILAHNHPSGDAYPSHADIRLTKQLKKNLAIADLFIVDHIVVGHNQALSMRELGLI